MRAPKPYTGHHKLYVASRMENWYWVPLELLSDGRYYLKGG